MAPQTLGVFAGFDLLDESSITALVRALNYWRGGGRNRGHPAVRELGSLGQESVRTVVGRMQTNRDFRAAVEGLLGHYGDMVTAAAGLAAYAVVDADDAASVAIRAPPVKRLKLLQPGIKPGQSCEIQAVNKEGLEEARYDAIKRNQEAGRKLQEREEASQKPDVRTTLPFLHNPLVRTRFLLPWTTHKLNFSGSSGQSQC